MTQFADLADLPEDDRIAIIGKYAEGHIVGVPIDDEPEKVARYIEKITSRFNCRHISTGKGLVPNTVTMSFGPPAEH